MKRKGYLIAVVIFAVLIIMACSVTVGLPKTASNVMSQLGTAIATAQASTSQSPASQAPASQAHSLTPTAPLVVVTSPPTPPPAVAPDQSGILGTYQNTFINIYQQVSPSVVNIHVIENQSGGSQTFPFFTNPGQSQPSEALGSGFVWDTQGDIVTNNHVIAGAASVDVTFSDGTNVPGKVIGADQFSDLAIVKVDVPASQLHPVRMGDSTQVKVGELAIAIGNPFGLQGTMTSGIVSAVGRSISADQTNTTGPSYTIPDIIQTDAAINPGNSGGVLVDDQGLVIGVTSAIESPTQANTGIGFAIPAHIVQRVAPSLIKTGSYTHPWIGIIGTALTRDIASAMNLNAAQRGALVLTVTAGSPAEKAGLRAGNNQVTIAGQSIDVGGDVILAVNDTPVNGMDDLIAYLEENTQVGQTITLTILRGGKTQKLELTLGARPTTTTPAASTGTGNTGGAVLGITTLPLTSEIIQAMKLPTNQQGVLIEQVTTGGPADLAGLRGGNTTMDVGGQQVMIGGDVIIAIDGQTITVLRDLRAFLAQAQPDQQVQVTVLRDGKQVVVPVILGAQPGQ